MYLALGENVNPSMSSIQVGRGGMEAVVAVGGVGQHVVGKRIWHWCSSGLLVSCGIAMGGEDLAQREEV